jgi:hypothetical protein
VAAVVGVAQVPRGVGFDRLVAAPAGGAAGVDVDLVVGSSAAVLGVVAALAAGSALPVSSCGVLWAAAAVDRDRASGFRADAHRLRCSPVEQGEGAMKVLGLLLVVLMAGCSAAGLTGGASELTYEVEGTGSASMTYSSDGGSIEQVTEPLPWSITVSDPGIGANLSAQKQDPGTDPITCRVLDGGEVVAEATSNSEFGIASCVPSP